MTRKKKSNMTPAPLVKKDGEDKPRIRDLVVGDNLRIFGVTRKIHLDKAVLDKHYTKVTWGIKQIQQMIKLMKAFDTDPEKYDLWLPFNEGLLVAIPTYDKDDQVFLIAPRTDPMSKLKEETKG